ncbi:Ankyrin repeat-containing domain containing protein [Trema orientale]|uniref:Ankyrin repeat-containing domain containing protein n=1 Tax=Trema orientale TaxID=63057 RepID=A0A2P5FRS6_TREOI|nr:Ankyrin repeat-containing domain containing protein [Trema orientale]
MSKTEAVRNGHYKVANILLEVEPKLAFVENNEGESPLYLAAREGQTLLAVAALIAIITFSAPFTMPGGFNNDAGPHQGLALLESP